MDFNSNKIFLFSFYFKGAIFLEGVTVKGVTQVTTQPKLGEVQQKCHQFCGWEG